MDLVPVIKITRMHGGRRVPAAADLVLAGRPITRVERVTAVQGARNRGFLLSACEGWALGWTLAALVALAVQTLLGVVSNALCLLATADTLLQVELLLHGGLGEEALALDVAHQSSALSLGREAPQGALEGLVVGEHNAEIDRHAW